MLNLSTTKTRHQTTKTLQHVLLVATALTALVLLIPQRSEAGVRVRARIGSVNVGYHSGGGYSDRSRPHDRNRVVRGNGRHRRVVRNERQNHRGRGWQPEYSRDHERYVEVWVAGRYESKIKRNGHQKTQWVRGHWEWVEKGHSYN